jgi:4-amino-4-deoxy-L-arabinose transferase-like glycosyltransferase
MKTTWDRLALILSLLVIVAAALVGNQIYDNIPHLEDEFAYLWQARIMADGELTLPSPDFEKSFLIPFVIDFQGQRFGKYPPGWPAALSLGVRVGLTHLINPLLAGLAAWLTYRLGKRTLGKKTALLGTLLLATSPLFLIQAGSLLSHVWSLVLTLVFILSWIDSLQEELDLPGWLPPLLGGLSLGTLVLTRPLTGLAVCLPFAFYGLILLIRGPAWKRKQVLFLGSTALVVVSLYFVWQYAVTGDFLTNPYTLWWPYDKYGFGKGYGITEKGHSLIQGWRNTRFSLKVTASDLFGWLWISWIFLPAGLWAARKKSLVYYSGGIAVSLLLLYLGYWVSSWLLGARYYIEALPGIALLSAAGIIWLAGIDQPPKDQKTKWSKLRPLGITALLSILIFSNIYYYLPFRLSGLGGLYGIEKEDLAIFESPELKEYQPALVIVDSERWMPYGSTLILESPRLDSPLIFAWSIGPSTDRRLAEFYQGTREILYYYPDQDPGRLYTYPHPGSLIE